MSNLLEKAIVDAKALKEAALKNAEQLVIEKYSEEVKEAVGRLLEQDMMDMGPDLGADPALDTGTGLDMGDDLDLGMEEVPGEEVPTAGEEPEEEPLDPESLMGGLPDAFNSDDDEIISIKLDSLEAEYEEETTGPFAGDDKFDDDEIGIDIAMMPDESEEQEEFDLEEPIEDDAAGIDITDDIMQEVLGELGIEEDDVDLDDLMEKVRVDFEPVKSGWAGTPESIMKEYESMLVAREQDSEVKEENEELRKAVKALKQENKTLTSATRKLQMKTEKYETAFDTLQEKLETMNVSNAKLLYINQALENASLNERQKRKIVEAISKADTVQEAKIVFDTMNEAVSTSLDVRKNETLNEVVSRRSSLLVAARNEQPKKDANPMYNRLQKLAGIKTQKS
ncbi:MAG: hypothetical protein CBD16_05240 [Betaproteobacteria bacterium TMED156]|nr:MAG: hypothetical protein CBD16_05240 [Betaproteobacteria bacterium TMED156]